MYSVIYQLCLRMHLATFSLSILLGPWLIDTKSIDVDTIARNNVNLDSRFLVSRSSIPPSKSPTAIKTNLKNPITNDWGKGVLLIDDLIRLGLQFVMQRMATQQRRCQNMAKRLVHVEQKAGDVKRRMYREWRAGIAGQIA